MKVLVATDNDSLATDVRDKLVDARLGCASISVLSLQEAADRYIQLRPDAIMLGLEPNPDLALNVMREIQEILPTRVLTVGPAEDANLIMRAIRGGAYQYVDQALLAEELPAAIKRLQVDLPVRKDAGRVITILGSCGGSGASTIAVNIATSLAMVHKECALVDLKLEAGDLAAMLNLRAEHTLADFCAHADRMDASMFDRCFTRHSSGVAVLAAPNSHRSLGAVTVKGLRRALAMAREAFPYTIVDLGSTYRAEPVQALYQSDEILLVVRLDFTSLRQARRVLGYLKDLHINTERVRLVVNRHRQPRELPIKDAEEALGLDVFYRVPDEPHTVIGANNKGVPIVLDKPRAKVARSLMDLAHSVNGKHTQHA